MKHSKILLLLLFVVVISSSCSDSFLNRMPKGYINTGNYTPDDSDKSILARGKLQEAYSGLRSYGLCWGAMGMQSLTTPDADKGSSPSDGGEIVQMKPMNFNASNSCITNYYKDCYNVIYRTNEAFALIESLPDSTSNKNEMLAETLVLRASMYFRLTQAFGAVPYVDHILQPTEKTPPRTSKDEIYGKVRSQLQWAIQFLPTRVQLVSSGNQGRMTRNAALAVLAKMAMYSKDWQATLGYTRQIIESGDNNLSTPYAEIFKEKNEYGPESVFEIYVDSKPLQKISMTSQYSQIQGVRGTPNLGWGFNDPSETLLAAYEPGDPRKEATVINDGEVLEGVKVMASDGCKHFNKKVYPWAEERGIYGRSQTASGDWINIRLIRYADIVLMYAEAANELNDTDEALAKLEMVRARARGNNQGVLPKITERNQDKLRQLIHHERRIELAMEFERYFDLVRWGEAPKTIPNFQVGKHELFPIPQIEIDRSDGILTQNPGY